MRYLERCDQHRRKPALKQRGVDGVDEVLTPGGNDRFRTLVSNLETGEPLWFCRER
jgi:hypothetical protein